MYRYSAWLGALLIACGGGAQDDAVVSTCAAEHPPSEPFDVGDTQGVAQPAPVPGQAPLVLDAPAAADIGQDCRDAGGSGCDESRFLSRDAAVCIAQAAGLAAGIRPWEVTLGYYQNHRRVIWLIMTVTGSSADGGYGGESLVLDATTGEELDRSGYTATP